MLARSCPKSEKDVEAYLKSSMQKNPNLIDILRTLVGVSDKRMYLELSYEFSKTRFKKDDKLNVLGYSIYDLNKKPLSFFKSLINTPNAALAKVATQIIINYFLRKEIFKVLKAISKVDNDELEILVENLILTKEVQQAEAKRRGHGAEFSLAKLINSLNVKMIPNERFMRAIGFIDPNVDRVNFEIIKKTKSGSWSFDL